MTINDTFDFPIRAAVEHKQLPLPGYAVHYFIAGRGHAEAIVFLHPAFADHRCFYRQVDVLSATYCVITLDMVGHGLSQTGESGVRIDATAEHVRQILLAEGYDKAHVVGVSLGGLMAQYFAVQNPDITGSITVLGAYDINRVNPEVAKAQRMEGLKWMLKAALSMKSFRNYVAAGTTINPEEQARFLQMAQGFTRRSFLVMGGMENVVKGRGSVLTGIPMLVLVGDRDLALAQAAAQRWHADAPNTRHKVISNAGHCANMDNAPEFNDALVQFIRESGASQRFSTLQHSLEHDSVEKRN